MALLLMMAQCLPAMWRMQCSSSGRTSIHWGTAKSCCLHAAPVRDVPSVDMTCCTFTKTQPDLDSQLGEPALQVPSADVLVEFRQLPFSVCAAPFAPPVRSGHDPPPRLTALEGLVLLGVLRV